MTTASYARYSSDSQRESSIDDQLRNCAQWASRNGLALDLTFADYAISGSSNTREQYQAMLAAAEAGRFAVLLVDSLERLGRDQEELGSCIKRLEYIGVRVVGVSDGYDSKSPKQTRKVTRTIKGLMGELYLDELAEKTHRGQTGAVLNNKSAGGKSYGYTSTPVEHPTKTDQFGRPEIIGAHKAIDPEQAKWVQHIFQRFADGHSTLDITNELNRLGVPAPRGGTWARSAIYGRLDRGEGILSNPLYIGQYIWNRTQWIKEPGTGKRKRIDRPESEWLTQDVPELRIIDQQLWDRVKSRQQAQAKQTRQKQVDSGTPTARNNPPSKYLFSGLLKCGCCGGNFIMMNRTSYGCARHKDRGETVCDNGIMVKRALVETTLLASIKKELLNDEYLQLFISETRRLLKEQQKTTSSADYQKQLKAAEKKRDNLLAFVMEGKATQGTHKAMDELETDITRLQAQMEQAQKNQNTITALLPNAKLLFKQMVEKLEEIDDVPATREHIKTLLGDEITLNPVHDKKGSYLEAELKTAPEQLLAIASGSKQQIGVVAGARFGAYLLCRVPLIKEGSK